MTTLAIQYRVRDTSLQETLQSLELEKIKNLQLTILKYIYLNFETSVKRRKEERRKERKQKSQQVNHHYLNIATSLKVKVFSVKSLHRWDISLIPHQMGFISCSPAGLSPTYQWTPPCTENTHIWHNLPLPPRATQWHSKYRGKRELKTLFFIFITMIVWYNQAHLQWLQSRKSRSWWKPLQSLVSLSVTTTACCMCFVKQITADKYRQCSHGDDYKGPELRVLHHALPKHNLVYDLQARSRTLTQPLITGKLGCIPARFLWAQHCN